jgi:hypothetical protein
MHVGKMRWQLACMLCAVLHSHADAVAQSFGSKEGQRIKLKETTEPLGPPGAEEESSLPTKFTTCSVADAQALVDGDMDLARAAADCDKVDKLSIVFVAESTPAEIGLFVDHFLMDRFEWVVRV